MFLNVGLSKHFTVTKQEDAHVFLRYFIESMEKAALKSCSSKCVAICVPVSACIYFFVCFCMSLSVSPCVSLCSCMNDF